MRHLAAVALVFVLLAGAACGSSQSTRGELVSGMRLSMPKSWSIHRLGSYCRGRIGPGLLITNIKAHNFTHAAAPGECTNAWKVKTLPKNFVLIDISRFAARSLPRARSFPISDSELQQTTVPCPSCRLKAINFWNGDRDFDLRVWTGNSASSGDRGKLAALIKSIRPE